LNITAWHIVKKKHRASAFTGEGARLFGGRWNSKGVGIIYTSASPSLAVLEILVHLDAHDILQAYLLAEISFDVALVEHLPASKLPADWRKDPAPVSLRNLGDEGSWRLISHPASAKRDH
jgi:RES domain-containing protein